MAKWLRIAGLAAFCLLWGFLGSVGAIALTADSLRGEQGPAGEPGHPGSVGPVGPAGRAGPRGPSGATEVQPELAALDSRLRQLELVSGQTCLRTVDVLTDLRVTPGIGTEPILWKDMARVCAAP